MMDSLPMAAAAPVLAITESAAAQFERMRAKRNKPEAVLRVRVVPDSGCGDFRYAMGIEPRSARRRHVHRRARHHGDRRPRQRRDCCAAPRSTTARR